RLADHRGLGDAWRHRVDPDVVCGQLQRQHPAEVGHRGLTGAVRGLGPPGAGGGDRGDGHDRSLGTVVDHHPGRRPRRQEGARDVDPHGAFPHRQVQVQGQRRGLPDTGGGDQAVQPPEPLPGRGDRLGHRRLIGGVHRQPERGGTVRRQLGRGLAYRLLAQVQHGDLGAAGDQLPGGRQADPTGAAGDRHDLLRHAHISSLLEVRPGAAAPGAAAGGAGRAETGSSTAAVICSVVADPPRSGVRTPADSTSSIAATSSVAAAGWPRWYSIMAPDQIWPTGLATPLPAMSGADPCTGSNIDGYRRSGLRFAEGAMPMLPATAAPRSVRMSPNRLDATTTSKSLGFSTNRPASASMWYWLVVTSGYSAANSRNSSSQNGMVWMIPLDLVAEASFPPRERASSYAYRITRVTPARVNTDSCTASSCGVPR